MKMRNNCTIKCILDIKWYLVAETDWSAIDFVIILETMRKCSGKSRISDGNVFLVYNSLSFSLSHGCASFKYSQGGTRVYAILVNPRLYITRHFAKFFPVVKRSALLKILVTVLREFSFYYEKMESESRWKNKEQSHAPARKRCTAWEYRSLSRAENSEVAN